MTDPIIDKIPKIRECICMECHENPDELAKRLLAHEATLKGRMIDPEQWHKNHNLDSPPKPSIV